MPGTYMQHIVCLPHKQLRSALIVITFMTKLLLAVWLQRENCWTGWKQTHSFAAAAACIGACGGGDDDCCDGDGETNAVAAVFIGACVSGDGDEASCW